MPHVFRLFLLGFIVTLASVDEGSADEQPNQIPALIKALRDPNVRYGASVALTKLGVNAVPALRESLASGNEDLPVWSAYTLGQIGPGAESAVGDLTKAEDNLKIRLDEFDKIDSKVNNNKSRLDILIGSIEQRGRQLSQINSDITSANTLAKSAEEELENLQAKVKIERGTLGNLQTQVATKGVEVARLDQTKSDLEQEIEKS